VFRYGAFLSIAVTVNWLSTFSAWKTSTWFYPERGAAVEKTVRIAAGMNPWPTTMSTIPELITAKNI